MGYCQLTETTIAIFGGDLHASADSSVAGSAGSLNEVWTLDGSKMKWKYYGGGLNESAIYSGSLYSWCSGLASPCQPHSRYRLGMTRVDFETFAIFGGWNDEWDSDDPKESFPDIWFFSTSKGWKRMYGEVTAVNEIAQYFTKGQYHPSSRPGSRRSSNLLFLNGTLYIFFGLGHCSTAQVYHKCNSIFAFSVENGEFAWLAGERGGLGVAVIGEPGVYSPANAVGPRYASAVWTKNSNEVQIFGGYGEDVDGESGGLSDLWEFRISDSATRFIGGSKYVNSESQYPKLRQYSSSDTTYPNGRHESVSFKIDVNTVFIFGGRSASYDLYDAWYYKISSNEFMPAAFTANKTRTNSWGKSVISQEYIDIAHPGGRRGSSGFYLEGSEEVVIFGGLGFGLDDTYGYFNDIWKFSYCNDTQVCGANNNEYQVTFDFFSQKQWKFVDGPATSHPICTSISTDYPCARNRMGFCSLSPSTLAIFGGINENGGVEQYFNDVWTFNEGSSSSNSKSMEWKYLSGGIDGLGVYSSVPVRKWTKVGEPKARDGVQMARLSDDEFVIFGGWRNLDESGGFASHDIWKFSTSRQMWMRVYGDDSMERPEYEDKGSYSKRTKVGSRHGGCIVVMDEIIYILLGRNYEYYNSIYAYRMADDIFAWMAGDAGYQNAARYGTKGVYSTFNNPSSRYYFSAWIHSDNEIDFYGGYDLRGDDERVNLADLWRFRTTDGALKFMGGSMDTDAPLNIERLREFSKDYHPGGRRGHLMIKVNPELVFLFSGKAKREDKNDVWFLNDKNEFMMVFPQRDEVYQVIDDENPEGGAGRYYNELNFPGTRYYQAAIPFGMNEVLIFGGYGYGHGDYFNSKGSLGDIWLFKVCNLTWKCPPNSYPVTCSGNCTCSEGFRMTQEGGNCLPICPGGCGKNSACTSPGRCECIPEFVQFGRSCTTRSAAGFAVFTIVSLSLCVTNFALITIVILLICVFVRLKRGFFAKGRGNKRGLKTALLCELEDIHERWIIDAKSISLVESIAKSGSVAVFKASLYGNTLVAVKVFPLKQEARKAKALEREVRTLSTVVHASIVRFYGVAHNVFNQADSIGIVCEFCENGNLKTFIQKHRTQHKKKLSIKKKAMFFKQLCSALSCIHSAGIIHRDVKPANCLVDRSENLKICDFGLARAELSIDESKTSCVGTQTYISPELVLAKDYDFKIDSYSLAILVYVVITENFRPFSKFEESSKIQYGLDFKIANSPEMRPDLSKIEDPEVRNFCEDNWKSEPEKRWEMSKCVEFWSQVCTKLSFQGI